MNEQTKELYHIFLDLSQNKDIEAGKVWKLLNATGTKELAEAKEFAFERSHCKECKQVLSEDYVIDGCELCEGCYQNYEATRCPECHISKALPEFDGLCEECFDDMFVMVAED